MGSITENYANLSQLLLAEHQSGKSSPKDIFQVRVLKPLLPAAIRIGRGQIGDIKDRLLGPFDLIGGWEAFPAMGDGMAAQFMMDGVAFCLQVRNWKEEDLTQYAEMAGKLRAMIRRTKTPLYCGVVSFEPMSISQVLEFMKSGPGQVIDALLCVGQHLTLRNSAGWYGDPKQIPLVTEKGDGESLKGFAFWITHVVQMHLGIPYTLSDYQHL